MISIVSAYPDFLDLYGEYSAVKLLEKRLETGSQQVRVSTLTFGRYAELENADMIYVGAGTEDRMLSALEDLRGYAKQIREFLENHTWTAILAVAGLILAVLILTVGFWKTVLILALVAVFALAGAAMDRDGGESARNFFQNLFHKDGKQGK